MLVKAVKGNIFDTNAKNIAFAINTEGLNDSGFAGKVSKNWIDLADSGKNRLGMVISNKINDKTFYALVCHSLYDGWGDNQAAVIRDCFNNIPSNGETIATVAIGTGNIGKNSGANFGQIICGMHDSNQNIIIYSELTLEELMDLYDREKIESIEKKLI